MSDFSPIFSNTNQILFDTLTDKTKCMTENTTSMIRISTIFILEAYNGIWKNDFVIDRNVRLYSKN